MVSGTPAVVEDVGGGVVGVVGVVGEAGVLGPGERDGGVVMVGGRLGIGVLGAVGSGETGVTVAELRPEPLVITRAITMPTTSSTAAPATSHSQLGNRGGSGGGSSPDDPPPGGGEGGCQSCLGSRAVGLVGCGG